MINLSRSHTGRQVTVELGGGRGRWKGAPLVTSAQWMLWQCKSAVVNFILRNDVFKTTLKPSLPVNACFAPLPKEVTRFVFKKLT